ncbi:MAG: alpha/beta hydrolase [Bacteroidia bacterium]
MKKSKHIFSLQFLLLALFTSCLRLDDNLYNLSKITEYKLDAYTGEVDFILDASYDIPSSNIHKFNLESDGNKIYAIYIGEITRISTDTVIMYCHGNKDHMDFYWQRAKLLAHVGGKMRYGVLMIDYRGYGMSEGKPTEEGLYQDVDAALNWLKQNGLNSDRLVIYGFSMGSAPATELSAKVRSLKPSKLILEAPFASSAVMVQDAAVLNMPASYFTNLKIDNAEEIKYVKQPFMWIHGLNDSFLNVDTHGRVIYENYKGIYAEAHLISDAEHGNIPIIWGFTNYCDALEKFIVNN